MVIQQDFSNDLFIQTSRINAIYPGQINYFR